MAGRHPSNARSAGQSDLRQTRSCCVIGTRNEGSGLTSLTFNIQSRLISIHQDSFQLYSEHRDRTAIKAFNPRGDLLAGPAQCDYIDERQVVVRRQRREHRVAADALVVDQRSVFGGNRQTFETQRPTPTFTRLLVSQCDHGINAHSVMCGDKAREERDSQQEHRYGDKR